MGRLAIHFGISIYWASPIYQHKPDPNTVNTDVAADIGIWICAHVPGLHHYSSPPDWIYKHMSLGPGMLALDGSNYEDSEIDSVNGRRFRGSTLI